MKKPCPRTHCDNLAIIDPIYGILPCQSCQNTDSKIKITKSPEFYSLAKKDRIQRIRDKNARDLIQPYLGGKVNKDFFEAYPNKVKDYNVYKELEKL